MIEFNKEKLCDNLDEGSPLKLINKDAGYNFVFLNLLKAFVFKKKEFELRIIGCKVFSVFHCSLQFDIQSVWRKI